MRDLPRAPRPRQRSTAGPFAFMGIAGAIVLVAILVIPSLLTDSFVGDAFVSFAADKDSVLRQPAMRAVVAARLPAGSASPADPNGTPRPFVIRLGETARTVGAALERAGLVRSGLAFTIALYDQGAEEAIQAGTYTISPRMSPAEIAKVVVHAPGEQVTLRIIEGWRLTEIAAAVQKTFPHIAADAFVKAAVVGTRKEPFLAGLAPSATLEGFLFPDSYFFRPRASADEVIDTLVATFATRAGATVTSGAGGLAPYDVVRLASIVEREARDRSESPIIAGVYANRLRIGMKLDADPTIQYAKGDWAELLLSDLELSSPYNTYRVAGLPPTPICSPGQAALEGAAKPASVSFLYFVAKSDGTHVFANTLDEHEANRVKVGNR